MAADLIPGPGPAPGTKPSAEGALQSEALAPTVPVPLSGNPGPVAISAAELAAVPPSLLAGDEAAYEETPPAVELERRAERLRGSDAVGAARAYVELGIFRERVLKDRAGARAAYDAARSLVRTLEPALTRVRRLLERRTEIARAIETLDEEVAIVDGEAQKADLYAERARASAALGRLSDARMAYTEALRIAPLHAASLRGLEAVLRRELAPGPNTALATQLAVHLEHVADAYAPATDRPDGDARLAAWIQVERASLLDALGQPDVARLALERAVALEPAPGPVRDALTRHLVRHAEPLALAASLAAEADLERDDDRASRLLYTAGRVFVDKLAPTSVRAGGRSSSTTVGTADGIQLLRRAAARAPKHTPTAARTLNELIRLLEANGDMEAGADVRQKRLAAMALEPDGATPVEAVAHEHVRLSEIFEGLGRAEQAAFHAESALALDPADTETRERLDRALEKLGRHPERARAWVAEANADRPVAVRVAALLRAAEIADTRLRRRDEAVAHLRAAFTIDPTNAAVFEALSALFAPLPRDPDSDGRGVRARIELYSQAAKATVDRARKVALLEKLVGIWEDELAQPARAIEEIEKVLAIEPGRRTAILALARNAERAGDVQRLARALTAEADLTEDPALRRRLLLRSADVYATRVDDRERAFALVDRALALDAVDPEALRARFRLQDRAGRFEEARRSLLALIGRETDQARRFALWIEVALLDEQRLRRPHDAVLAYRQAALQRPRHPTPAREIARLLRSQGEPAKLVDALMGLAAAATDPHDHARFLFDAAEVEEFLLHDDKAAMKSLAQADATAGNDPDPALLEAMERILLRGARGPELAALYARWIERQPPPPVDHKLRVALAGALFDTSRNEAAVLLEGLVSVVRGHVPGLRMLEQLHRVTGADARLSTVLRAQSEVFGSRLARAGALWELVALEEQLGDEGTLDALARLTAEDSKDAAALDATMRVANKLAILPDAPAAAAQAARGRLVPAMRARRELTRDPVARAAYRIEEALISEGESNGDAAALRSVLGAYRAAMTEWPESVLAARGVERLSDKLGDRASLIESQRSLAKLAETPRDTAKHLVRAAALTAEDPEPGSQVVALALYEEALVAYPDGGPAATALTRMLAADVTRLVERLGDALDRATRRGQVILLGTEIGRAILRVREAAESPTAPILAGAAAPTGDMGPDAGVGVAAMRHVLAVAPDNVGVLLLMARLLMAARVYSDAKDILLRAIAAVPHLDVEARILAHSLLADLYETKLNDLPAAQGALQTVLAIDERNRRALSRLHQVATARGDHALGIQALTRLSDVTQEPAARVDVDLRLSEACREAGDAVGRVRALADAVVALPSDGRAWNALAHLYRPETPEGATRYAEALQQVLDIATARRLPADPRWLSTLGMLEITMLMRSREGVVHLQQATMLANAPPDARVALGRGLEASGRNAEAVQVFREVMTADPEVFARITDLLPGLVSFEAALAKDGRVEERLSVEEVRACLGDVKGDRLVRLRARRLPEGTPYPGSLASAHIVKALVPEARTPLLDVAAAIAPIAAKVLRFELSGLGVTPRERLGPRDGHPTRMLADRLAKAFGIEAFELYLTPTWQGAARVYPGDPPAIVASTAFADLPEPEQVFALGRLLARIAIGPTWLDELPVDAVDGLLIAAVRGADPAFAAGELTAARESMAQSFLPAIQKAMGRRQRKQLEEIAPTVISGYDPRIVTIGVRRSEYRIAYVLGGDLMSAIDYLRRFDREIARSLEDPRVLVQHPVTNELLRYAMSAEGFAERRRVGSVWT